MEPAAAWVPCDFQLAPCWSVEPGDFQLANWAMEEQGAVWAPGLPVQESEFTDITGSCLQTSSPSSSRGGQLIAHAAATSHSDPIDKAAQELEVDFHDMQMTIHNSNHVNPIHVLEEVASEFKADIDMMKTKIHRYPASIRGLGELYTVPTTVAVGPYHHGQHHLKAAEKVKHVAAYHCIRESGCSVQEMYDAVVAVADDARRLYDKDVMAGIRYDDFRHMMFFDACFLVQYMLLHTSARVDPSLRSFFGSYANNIFHDTMLLENQLPWQVVEAVMRFRNVSLREFVGSLRGWLLERRDPDQKRFASDGDNYEPPHLLGLLRFCTVGRNTRKLPPIPQTESIPFSASAVELAEIGVTLTPSKTTELIRMRMKKKWTLFTKLSLAPLTLDNVRASCLVNMAALETCSIQSFSGAPDEDSAVCSYLLLLSTLVQKKEDVVELRQKRILQGRGLLTNNDDTLNFFTSLQNLRLGSCYVRIMEDVEDYKIHKQRRDKVKAFVYKNMKIIIAVITTIAAVVSILGMLMPRLKSR
ncbi:hypothetical protein GQ55_8G256200 [Panicum hallii var. hallii]|uniref:Uncharacterized protein n=1 Tax=Panicum hallii var. hallii TaxID=1504633 RepID=A0A2T7CRD7_9POAL|nr:hypothetical protein GQ55_8G256200 [Panicum hallii var. hallii]